jgi:2-iminobutanoate/2-iminopropanoate deaminase
MVRYRPITPTETSYAQALEVSGVSRMLFVSGQIPEDENSVVPEDFESQCRLVWRNVETQLIAAGMSFANLVKVTTYLSDRRYRETNSAIRCSTLGTHSPALTVIIAGIYDEAWLLEIEAIAAA